MSFSIKEIRNLHVNTKSLQPELTFTLLIEYPKYDSLLLGAEGRLVIGQKEIADVRKTIADRKEEFRGQVFHNHDLKMKAVSKNGRTKQTLLSFFARLSQEAIIEIENTRQKDKNKDVNIGLQLNFSYLKLNLSIDDSGFDPRNLSPINFLDSVFSDKKHDTIKINQSVWIQEFAKPLGIGNFLLIELKIPENLPTKRGWTKMFKNLQTHLVGMEKSIRTGEWEQVMVYARQFFEDLRLGKSTPLKNKLEQLFELRNGSNVGFNEYYDSIENMFNYFSKFIHTKDRSGNHYTKPIPKIEDAYMAYSQCLALMNLLSHKVFQS